MDTDLHWVLGAYERIMRADPHNLRALCETGKALHQLNRPQEARKCYKSAVEVLKRAIRAGDADAALNIETAIYVNFVRTIEDENHYYRCFSDWREDMAKLGRQFRKPGDYSGNPRRIAFYLHTGFMLGHTEVMFKILENIPPARRADLLLRIYVLDNYDQAFLERAEKVGVEVVAVAACLPGGSSGSRLDRLLYLRDRLQRDEMGVCVWVSSPDKAAFTLSMRLAPVQIFWALRFHPITGSYIDGYITGFGARDETERVYGKQKWAVCPTPLTINTPPQEPAAVAAARSRYREPLLLGTIAREDKINSKPYLDCIARILQMHPDAGYLWTGKEEHAGIARFFRDAGVSHRCHFIGWVDVNLYSRVLDVFLESFPLGAGVSGYHALAAELPLVSYLAPNTVFGNHLWHKRTAEKPAPEPYDINHAVSDPSSLSSSYILCPRTPDEYVAFASRLVTDQAFRQAVGRAGRVFYEDEAGRVQEYTLRFFDTIRHIAHAKPAPEKSA